MGETVKTEDRELVVRSLVHYSCRLKELQDHPDIKKGNSILKLDLDQNAKNAVAIKNSMPSNFDDVIGTKEGKIICRALLCYVSDLKTSIGKSNELMGNINMEFQNVQNENNEYGSFSNSSVNFIPVQSIFDRILFAAPRFYGKPEVQRFFQTVFKPKNPHPFSCQHSKSYCFQV